QFYKGVGDYHLMNTCNQWTAKGLKSTGMDISPTFKLTAGSVMKYVAANNSALTRAINLHNSNATTACRLLPTLAL
ncbi:DUF2459 domain-containing protein, partial [Photobacterium sagamiensis]|uniref:DUF2459 domain-containing protein n=1 Tax=Photobacterium sagamiensis TaxID=2910241 RepID=UPI003D09624E